jgi:hypothetical protein
MKKEEDEYNVGHGDDIPRVAAAAIIGRDGKIYSLPPPCRHHDVGRYMIEQGHPKPFPGGDSQGFLLSNGDFVSRRAARGYAFYHGQLLPCAGKTSKLFSEDVW